MAPYLSPFWNFLLMYAGAPVSMLVTTPSSSISPTVVLFSVVGEVKVWRGTFKTSDETILRMDWHSASHCESSESCFFS